MLKNMKSVSMFLLVILGAPTVLATPQSISSDERYKDSLRLIEKYGRQGMIDIAVKMQREQMNQHGNSLDKYSAIGSVSGAGDSLIQTGQINTELFLKDANKQRAANGMKAISEEELLSHFKKGGKAYNAQITMLCTNPATRGMIDSGIIYEFKNYDNNMKFINHIEVDESTCKENDS